MTVIPGQLLNVSQDGNSLTTEGDKMNIGRIEFVILWYFSMHRGASTMRHPDRTLAIRLS